LFKIDAKKLLDLLCCPKCFADLSLAVSREDEGRNVKKQKSLWLPAVRSITATFLKAQKRTIDNHAVIKKHSRHQIASVLFIPPRLRLFEK
jgi:uncharacterized protein YbaR (Trm112 family)